MIRNKIITPQRCRDCPFFEIRHSSLGVSFFCRYYKKGRFELPREKFSFCKVQKIEVIESMRKDN